MNLWIGRQVTLELSNGSIAKGMLILNGQADHYAISVGSGMRWELSQEAYNAVKLAE